MLPSAAAVLVMSISSLPQPPQSPEAGRLADITRAQSYLLGRPSHVRISSRGKWVLYLRGEAENPVLDLWGLDLDTRKNELLLSAETLLAGGSETLSEAEKAMRERQRIKTRGFTDYRWIPRSNRIVSSLDGKLYLYDLELRRSVRIELPKGVLLTPRPSPTGEALAFVLDHDVYMVPLPETFPEGEVYAPEPVAITTGGTEQQPHGVAEFVAQEEMSRYDGFWWSPDGSQILYQANDDRALERFTIADAARPEKGAHTFPYPRPGKTNVDVRLFLTDLSGGTPRPIEWDRARYPYLSKVSWSGPLLLVTQSRDQRAQVAQTVDLSSGRTHVLFEERDPAWLNIHDSTPRFSSDGTSFLWATEEGGAWRLERKYLSDDGLSVVRREVVVPESASFGQLLDWDEDDGALWFTASPNAPEQHIFRTPDDGHAPPTPVTEGSSWNEAHVSSRAGFVAITESPVDGMPTTRIHPIEADGLGEALVLPHVAETPSRMPEVELVAPEQAGGFHACILRPEGFDPAKKYPVVVYVYGGPGFSVVKANASQFFVQQWIADHGFVVVSLDGRGTPRRGRDFERALREKFHEVPLDDQIAGVTALAKNYPELDLDRVGIYGWSFGGYMSALAVLRRPDFFKAGSAGAPVVDWMYYDTHYTERYLGVPEDETDPAYAQGNLLSYAEGLERPLLLLHGIADDNVYFAHSLQLADALFKAGKPFELVPLVGLTHMVNDPVMKEALFRRIVTFLGRSLW